MCLILTLIVSGVRIVVPEYSRSFDENEANEIAHALTKCPVKSPKRTAVGIVDFRFRLNIRLEGDILVVVWGQFRYGNKNSDLRSALFLSALNVL